MMSNIFRCFKKSIFYFLAFMSLLLPGGSFLLGRRFVWAFSVPFIGLLGVFVICFTRWVITPTGLSVLVFGLITLHVVTYVWGLILVFKTPHTIKTLTLCGVFVALAVLNSCIVVACHVYKGQWFGFGFYHIPSSSMHPTLQRGDVVLINTWAYTNRRPIIGDVLILKRSEKGIVLAKRLTKIREHNQNTELFIEGDNALRSTDSRKFGWVSSNYILGEVKFVWFSFLHDERALLPVQ